MVNQENLESSLADIRQAARDYYARKNGSWKPKRDLDAEHLEDMARYRREMGMYAGSWIMPRYFSRPAIRHVDLTKMRETAEAFRKLWEIDFSSLEERIKETISKKIDMVVIDELPDIKDYKHRFLHGEWEEPTSKYVYLESPSLIGAGKNPFAEHTIRAVKKSHRKRGFSKKSRRGIMLQG